MTVTLGKNISSLRTQRALNNATDQLAKSYTRLSSGMRINSASDDAAGLAISSQLTSKARVFNQAIRNVNDGLSAANIAEGALNSVKEISQRQLELAEQAANGTYSVAQRRALNLEANKLVDEFNRIVGSTTFNGMNLLDPALGTIGIQAGIGSDGVLTLGVGTDLRRAIGDGTFTAGQSIDGTNHGATTGDLNGDGLTDLVVDAYSGGFQVYFGNGDGTLRTGQTLGVGITGVVLTGDFDADGKTDLLASLEEQSQLIMLHGNGDGSFRSGITTTVGFIPKSMAVTDVNGDGKLDFLSTDGSNNVHVGLGNGNGTFRVSSLSGPGGYGVAAADFSITAGDFNNDGRVDFATVNSLSTAYIFLGNGNGTFAAPLAASTNNGAQFVRSADFNNDGFLDLVVCDISWVQGNNTTQLLLGNGDGTFVAARSIWTAGPLVSGDLNGDGYLDLTGAGVTLFGNGDGTFRSLVLSTAESQISATGDFNGDGRTDLVSTNRQIYLGNGGNTTNAAHVNICSQQGARDAIGVINANLDRVGKQLGSIGATTSRFSAALGTLLVQRENFLAAANRIQDADIAAESANLIRQQILQQAGASVLAQANGEPRLALTLLSG